ncbi:hypothetical protein ACIPSA_26030 [Streptomyces sp. NPDC086549]|uniref:hypothetical protein n=1 Tax=Streptomyces sp. NPDC086549 TaxID=3365752 RepID=UPI0037F2082C
MARPALYTAIMLGAGTLFTTAMTTASAVPAASSQASPSVTRQSDPVLVNCFMQPDVHPKDFILACGDGNSRLVEMHWSDWGPSSATAVGVNVVNDCKPYCAAGTFHGFPVIIRLDRPEPWKKDPQVRHFTRMSLTYTDTRPDGYTRVMTYPLWS